MWLHTLRSPLGRFLHHLDEHHQLTIIEIKYTTICRPTTTTTSWIECQKLGQHIRLPEHINSTGRYLLGMGDSSNDLSRPPLMRAGPMAPHAGNKAITQSAEAAMTNSRQRESRQYDGVVIHWFSRCCITMLCDKTHSTSIVLRICFLAIKVVILCNRQAAPVLQRDSAATSNS
jgi:hypothetical protein